MNQFLTFAAIGICNTIIDLTIWKLLLFAIGTKFDKYFQKFVVNKYGFCHIISALITFNFSYYMNKTFTFQSDVKFASGFGKFFTVSFISMILAAKVLSYFTRSKILKKVLPNHAFFDHQYTLICKLTTVIIFMFVNYFGQKYLVF